MGTRSAPWSAIGTGPWDQARGRPPRWRGLVDDWAVGDVTDPDFTADLARDARYAVSALGVTRQRANPWDIDYRANLAVLRSAERHGTQGLCYVNVIGGHQCPAELTRAKTAFAAELTRSPIPSQVVSPCGFFSDMMQVLTMAQRGRVLLMRPSARINPVHGADLARYCVDRLDDGRQGQWDVGGPEVFTWQGMARCAFEVLARPARITTIPQGVVSPLVRALGLVAPRQADTMRFITWGMLHDCVGQRFGTHTLGEFYRRQTDRARSRG